MHSSVVLPQFLIYHQQYLQVVLYKQGTIDINLYIYILFK